MLTETIFINSQPVGVIRMDSNTGQFVFSPIRGKSLIPDREWRNVDELKAAVLAAYQEGLPDEAA